MRSSRCLPVCLALVFLLAPLTSLQAKMSTWKDVQGASFKGEPTGILGPFAVFRTGSGSGRRVLLRAFTPEDCRRIHAEIAALPPRADSFAQAKGYATSDLVGHVGRIRNKELAPADLSAQPEPELLLVLSGSHNSGDGWFMASNFVQFYHRIQRLHPGLMEAVFLGARHDPLQQRNMATQSGMPWLVADLPRQAGMSELRRFIPQVEGTNAVLVTRHGVPLVAGSVSDADEIQVFMDQTAELLALIDPENAAGWADRVHYLRATRPVTFAAARGAPLLVGNPLRAEGLRQYGVKRVAARLTVDAAGKVAAEIVSGPEDLPRELSAPLAEALSRAVVMPAIDHGQPVAGVLDYVLEVPPADPVAEAERVWLGSTRYPALTIGDWLVLRPIVVPEQDFASTVVGEKSDGTVILSALEVNSGRISRAAQLSAFNSDWFGAAGAGSVRPKEGERQRIDETTELTWERVRSRNGFVNMQTNLPRDYTVGYAWAEFESPRDTEAWLGLGSDDGVKIWLNGELVHDKWIRRPSRLDDDVVPLNLKRGANQILIKIQNVTIDWSFIYRLRLKP